MGSNPSKEMESKNQAPQNPPPAAQVDDDEPDEWDKRIFSTGCADENTKLTDCYYEKKDWRLCKNEMERFRRCWKAQGNETRTDMKNN